MRLHPAPDAAPASWIGPRLSSSFGAVTRTVPDSFNGYARVLHPAFIGDDPIRWGEVAAITGRTAHALAQWHALSRPRFGTGITHPAHRIDEPETGNVAPAQLRLLCTVLARHTSTADRCWFGLWEGWGWVTGASVAVTCTTTTPESPEPAKSSTPPAQLDLTAPRFHLPDRGYLLYTGPLDAATEMGYWYADWFTPQSPNLIWPEDKAWCVASEIDFDSTLVGGTAELIDAVLDAPELEAWPVQPTDSLAYDGDRINT